MEFVSSWEYFLLTISKFKESRSRASVSDKAQKDWTKALEAVNIFLYGCQTCKLYGDDSCKDLVACWSDLKTLKQTVQQSSCVISLLKCRQDSFFVFFSFFLHSALQFKKNVVANGDPLVSCQFFTVTSHVEPASVNFSINKVVKRRDNIFNLLHPELTLLSAKWLF